MPDVHVLPLTDDHAESPECGCGPLSSTRLGDDRIYVHRLDTIYVEPSPFTPKVLVDDGRERE